MDNQILDILLSIKNTQEEMLIDQRKMKQDIVEMKQDIVNMKQDIKELKQEQVQMKKQRHIDSINIEKILETQVMFVKETREEIAKLNYRVCALESRI